MLFHLQVGGLGDVVSGLSKSLQKRGHLVEIILPKYDCMQYDRIRDLRVSFDSTNYFKCLSSMNILMIGLLVQALDVMVESYFAGRLFKNKIWVGTVEG